MESMYYSYGPMWILLKQYTGLTSHLNSTQGPRGPFINSVWLQMGPRGCSKSWHIRPSTCTAKVMLESTFWILGITSTDASTLQHPVPDNFFLASAQKRASMLAY